VNLFTKGEGFSQGFLTLLVSSAIRAVEVAELRAGEPTVTRHAALGILVPAPAFLARIAFIIAIVVLIERGAAVEVALDAVPVFSPATALAHRGHSLLTSDL
jgi:hypothetical protein